ncbi:MAG TPA: VIT and VWA domain-containing protein [Terriglobia bacterium]|nr:VIT and VWA domain-containing protein [Terriglobia bacterium]
MRAFVITLLFVLPLAAADSGVLIPGDRNAPDPNILSLEEMALDILIDNNTARVSVREIFANHTNRNLEGTYSFALPVRGVLSDFAVWDDLTRIPGVILERKRAGEIYDTLRSQTIDPGILQMGERGAQEAARGSEFTARVTPIPARGTKRVEIEYHERVPVEQFESVLAIPLKPDTYQAQIAGRLDVNLTVLSERRIAGFEGIGKAYPLKINERSPNRIRASFSGTGVALTEDFAVKYSVDPSTADMLRVLTYRNPAQAPATGFFQASALFGLGVTPQNSPPRTVIAVFDTSLSMQWNKLDSSFRAYESLLRSLRPQDRFNVVVFNSDVSLFATAVQPANADQIERALAFVKQSRLRGATDLGMALERALAQTGGNAYVVLFTDGGSTQGAVQNARLVSNFNAQWTRIAEQQRPRMFVFAVGDDANLPVLRQVSSANGLFEWVRSTEPVDFKVRQFISKIGRFPIASLQLSVSPAGNTDMVYALEPAVFGGSEQTWIGRYRQPSASTTFTVTGQRDGTGVTLTATAALPADSQDHPALPRTWAKARVDALLEKIDRDGEDKASIDEIIQLSRKYKFVTPYTSFLAAPRSLLRPRVIRPGDPVLRVKTDASIRSVIAIFPFGLIKPLRYLKDEDMWQTRFLAPADTPDGTHHVQLVLRDAQGNAYREEKTFVIASKPPIVRATLDRTSYHRGEAVRLQVSASQTTRTIVARMYGVPPVRVTWNAEARSNAGEFRIPEDLPTGQYRVIVSAEDFARNIGTQEVTLAVVP